MTDRSNPLLLATNDLTTFTTTSGGAVGALAWGPISGNTARLYALGVNNGIQAFVVTVPEPSTAALICCCTAALALRRRRG